MDMDTDALKSDLIRLVEQIVSDSGLSNELNISQWLEEWLHSAVPALGFRSPSEFLDTEEGRELVRSMIKCMQSGTYN